LKSRPSKEIIWLQRRENQKKRPTGIKGSTVSKLSFLNLPNLNNRKAYEGLDGKVKRKYWLKLVRVKGGNPGLCFWFDLPYIHMISFRLSLQKPVTPKHWYNSTRLYGVISQTLKKCS
jgi:hypothetical protein